MLNLKDIKKYYNVGGTETRALDGVTVAFRKKEFVAILGPSGSGKTTMLNVIGGLDQYDSGDLIINGQSTKHFKLTDWDAYRNNSIGFVFQSYNLIGHQGILDNVELGMTLSGIPKEERRKRAQEALERVGLKDHLNKKPSQLSGGQMQRVAIARALANDPEILLCDEPTGALDSETSVQIMNLIQELSQEKLVIMVTHNPDLAREYADRIIEFSDGKILTDSNPYIEEKPDNDFELKRTRMSFLTALRLSFNNIRTKKGRTFLTSFASSIGIIGIAIVLSLSNGFQKQIDKTQSETLAQFPVTISQITQDNTELFSNANTKKQEKAAKDQVLAKTSEQDLAQHTNDLSTEYVDYIKKINPDWSNNVSFSRSTNLNLLRDVDGTIKQVQFSNAKAEGQNAASFATSTGVGISVFPDQLDPSKDNFLKQNYQVVDGQYPSNPNDLVLIVDENGTTNVNALNNLGFDVKNGESISYQDILGTTIKLAFNNAYYTKLPTGNFIPNQDLTKVYDNSQNQTLKIVGILKAKSSATMDLLAPGIAYSDSLTQEVIKQNKDSEIVKAQDQSKTNVLTNETLDETKKAAVLTYLGANATPSSIYIYPNNFKTKEKILTYLDDYNKGKDKADQVLYTDLAGTMTKLTGGLMDAITYVLVAFAGISLVTSMIMIGILTYTSVLERTKEIGVLKALGARKKDITRVFDAETAILGVASGVLGVAIAYAATFPINQILENLTDLQNVAQLNPIHAVILIVISTILTMLGGHLPARMAAKKDAAIALRAE
ncbi:ABC transporter ATP-binding/permease [Enterococcus sp. AZ150]|uniref:ABC transporter ATP-binding protein/permease n=1 Tax=Enterococcus sulfureus ATCC 49903 TaxID=1140003 RepID=S0KLD1_9ENTE|nr:ABC transporter ATP-binding protein/permease [Enterococcus sulfureus]EOT45517.1 ABC transporter ATP-binding protein/permease [Enterococcus sulfureus ATCC 49903]EOT83408.1 ABC transporter ATP-binding protein/permease [Enterococcus sulfureus ATCC 49903]